MHEKRKIDKKTKLVPEITGRMLKGAVSGSVAYVIYVMTPQYIFVIFEQALLPTLGGDAIRENSYLLPMGMLIFTITFIGAAMYRTVIQGACTVALTVASIVFLLILTSGGIMIISLPSIALKGTVSISAILTIDFRTFLTIYIIISSINILKGILESMSILLERQEKAKPIVNPIPAPT